MSYPGLADADRRSIESIRDAHDPQATLLAAHVTLVFPVDVAPDNVGLDVAAVADTVVPIRFVIRSAKAVREVRFARRGGTVETLDLVEIANGIVSSRRRFNLGSSRAS